MADVDRSVTRSACELTVASTWDGEPIGADEQVRVRLRLTARELRIAVRAPFHGDPAPSGAPGATDRLWEHEVVEIFVAGVAADDGAVRYTEVELSPWGHHLVLQLHGVRRVVASGLPLAFRTLRRGDVWLGAARLDRALLPPPPWRVNAFAIHGSGDERRYLTATALPGPPTGLPPTRALPGARSCSDGVSSVARRHRIRRSRRRQRREALMIRRSTLGLAAALVALACSGRNQTGQPVNETQAAPANATVATASPAPDAAPASPAPVAPPSEEIAATTKPEAAPAPPSGAPVPGDPSQIRRATVEETKALRESGNGVIVDVRDDASWNRAHIAGAVHIPLDQLAQRLGELPRDKPIVTYCA